MGFGTVLWDHDQAYQRVKRSPQFRCLVPVLSPGDWLEVEWVEAGTVVFLEMHGLLFWEAGLVGAYCLVATTIAVVLDLPCDHLMDNNVTPYRLDDQQAVHDLRELVRDVLRVHFKDSKLRMGLWLCT